MTSESAEKRPVFFTSEFKRSRRQLAKRYPKIRQDLEPMMEDLAQGSKPGNKIPATQFDLYKVRVRNSSARKGKSGGFRVIYEVRSNGSIVLITIYSKSDQEDISPNDLKRMVEGKEIIGNQSPNGQSKPK